MTDEPQVFEGYTARQAAEVLSRNSNRPVDPDYVRKLAQKNVIRFTPLDRNRYLYNKEDIDNYRVEDRGTKSGRAQRTRATGKAAKTGENKG